MGGKDDLRWPGGQLHPGSLAHLRGAYSESSAWDLYPHYLLFLHSIQQQEVNADQPQEKVTSLP